MRENIAAGMGSVDSTFNVWQSSGGHYASIVSGTTEAGFGYAVSRNGGTYWVGVYGSPAQGDEAGEVEGFAETETARLKAEAAKLAEESKPAEAKSDAAPPAETPAEKVPAAGGM
ncbi:MAG: CAP domain-containing protein [Pirellulaceae bacterium]|nr:CAP domain-containing protein [Pirellulaceae bacterium]